MKKYLTYWVSLLCIFSCSWVHAYDGDRKFDAENLRALQEAEELVPTDDRQKGVYGKEPSKWGTINERLGDTRGNNSSRSRSVGSGSGIFGSLARTIMYLLAGGIILVILYHVIKNNLGSSGQNIYTEGMENLEVGDIQKLDTQALIMQAVKSGNYREAVRLNYVDVLKLLDKKGRIKWTSNKTNQDYVEEVSKSKLSQAFEMLTHHFDYIWYGQVHIDEGLYKSLEVAFQDFKTQTGR